MRTTMSWMVIAPLILMTACAGMRRTARTKADAQAKIAMAENEIIVAKQAGAGTYAPQRILEAAESLSAAKREFEARSYDGAGRSAQAAAASARGAAQLAEEKKAKEEAKRESAPAPKAKAKGPAAKPKPKI